MERKSEIDWAIEILADRGQPMFWLELVEEIANRLGKKKDPESLTSMYTRLNLDNRLVYQGEGYWFYDTNRPVKAKV